MKRVLRVRDFMATELECIAPDAAIMDCAQQLVSRNVSGLLVVDSEGRLVGLITERDLIEVALSAGYHDESAGLVRDYMSTELVTVDATESVMDIAERFTKSTHRRFPALDDGKLVGLIARRDVLRALTSGAWFHAPP